MNQDELKALAGRAAVEYVTPGTIIGVGTGSTVDHFIAALGEMPRPVAGAVSSSERSTAALRALGIEVLDANDVTGLDVYVDGADEIDPRGYMIKGGGGALTREKIVAALASRFVCIVDASKQVEVLGRFPLPVEVIPLAAEQVRRWFAAGGAGTPGEAVLRRTADGAVYVTDNGQHILDVHGLSIADPPAVESAVNNVPGVVSVGVFAQQRATAALIGTPDGVRTVTF
nr:ribose-5-phosphate isomerase RpiA [Propionibacterium sp.]